MGLSFPTSPSNAWEEFKNQQKVDAFDNDVNGYTISLFGASTELEEVISEEEQGLLVASEYELSRLQAAIDADPEIDVNVLHLSGQSWEVIHNYVFNHEVIYDDGIANREELGKYFKDKSDLSPLNEERPLIFDTDFDEEIFLLEDLVHPEFMPLQTLHDYHSSNITSLTINQVYEHYTEQTNTSYNQGILTYNDLHKMLSDLNIPSELHNVFLSSIPPFPTMMTNVYPPKKHGIKVEDFFSTFDINGNNILTQDELIAYAQKVIGNDNTQSSNIEEKNIVSSPFKVLKDSPIKTYPTFQENELTSALESELMLLNSLSLITDIPSSEMSYIAPENEEFLLTNPLPAKALPSLDVIIDNMLFPTPVRSNILDNIPNSRPMIKNRQHAMISPALENTGDHLLISPLGQFLTLMVLHSAFKSGANSLSIDPLFSLGNILNFGNS